MKPQERKQLGALTVTELGERIAQLEAEIKSWYLKRTTSQIKNVREGKLLRKRLATVKTIWRQKQLASINKL